MATGFNFQEKILGDIKDISQQISRIESVNGVIQNYQKIQALYEKAAFLKQFSEEGINLYLKKEERHEMTEVNPKHENTPEMQEKEREVEERFTHMDTEITQEAPTPNVTVQPKEITIDGEAASSENEVVKPNIEEANLQDKIKLASIKSIKAETDHPSTPANTSEGSPEINSIFSNFGMSVEDKNEFQQKLFQNDENEMKQVLTQINDYRTLEDAKEYLSDVYYDRNWRPVDAYAQKLWGLIEKRFS